LSAKADDSQVCGLTVDKTEAAFPSDRISKSCRKGDIVVFVVPYGHETMLGGARFCDFRSAILIVDDPEQRVKKQTCVYIGSIRSIRAADR